MTKAGPPPLFTKVYSAGWKRIRALRKTTPAVMDLWMLLVEEASSTNALEASYDALAEELDLDRRTIMRAVAVLESSGAVHVFRSKAGNVYVLNNDEVWKNTEERKRTVSFTARRLVGRDHAKLRDFVQRKHREAEAEANREATVSSDSRNQDLFEPTH